ncbi:MAG: AAA family ATPase [Bacteroidales bacterium]
MFCGIRRCGKSFSQYQQIQRLIKSQHPAPFVYIDFEDERLIEFKSAHFDLILECAMELYAGQPILFFDEIQNIEQWEKYARRLADHGYQVYITGSNAKMLSKEIGTTLGGRYFIKEIYPLAFYEYLNFRGVQVEKNFAFSQ